jgi:hypothetical protein
MRSAWLAIGVLITSIAAAQTPSNKQEQVPTAILLNSRYVYVEAWDGDFLIHTFFLKTGRLFWMCKTRLKTGTDIWLRSNGAKPKFSL